MLSDAAIWRQVGEAVERQQWRRAAELMQPVTARQPMHPLVLYVAGQIAYWSHDGGKESRPGEALERAARLLTQGAQRAEFPLLWHNAAVVLRTQGQHAAALTWAARALAADPSLVSGWVEVGCNLRALGDVAGARAALEHAATMPTTGPEDALQQSGALLMLGRHREGWAAQAARRLNPRLQLDIPMPPHYQRWVGERAAGLVLYSEQGWGDTIQMLRYLPACLERAEAVWLVVRDPMAALVREHWPAVRLLAHGDAYPAEASHVASLMDLPSALPWPPPADAYVRGWAPDAGRRRVAVQWQGSRSHRHDKLRSMPRQWAAPLEARADLALVEVPTTGGWDAVRDTLSTCNAVVAVDTAVAHLAGAMGIPTHVLLAADSDARWTMDGGMTPWYPSWRLYRQPTAGDWASPVADVLEVV